MKKRNVISLLLCLALICTVLLPATSVHAAESDSGMVINKTATANEDGTYKITLEAYATGSKVISQEKKDVPTDIVLVLDQSGSMEDDIGSVSFSEYSSTTNSRHYQRRHNGGSANLYYPLGDGAYASVSVTVQSDASYAQIRDWNNQNYWVNRENLYALVNGEYQKVTVTWGWSGRQINYIYTLPDGTQIGSSAGNTSTPNFGSYGPLYQVSVDENANVYTYTYTDANGVTQTIGTSTGANTAFTTTLYQRTVNTSGGGSRIAALKTALKTFTAAVKEKAAGTDGELGTVDDVNHRIAVVGYASREDSNNPWVNTEVFVGANQYNYSVNASRNYGTALQDMNTANGQANVAASFDSLDTEGATYTNYGLEMANGILNANPVEDGAKRNRVVILFTDGYPGKNASDFNLDAANLAISEAKKLKDAGVSVYAVGIFSGADATSVGNRNGGTTEKANWFMQQVSSNNGTPQNPSYYLSAADAGTLNNIFQQISDQIESGGSATTLSEETVIKDVISDSFTLPAGATADNITLETYKCTGENSWTKNPDAMGAKAFVDGDQVSVTGFDFAENYVGTVTENGSTTYRGNKLVISFDVETKEGFLGGNGVYTNTHAGVYENSSAETPVLEFERPQVDIAIKSTTVVAPDKNVYLLQDVTVADLQKGATTQVGDVTLDLTKPNENWGLESWQNEYVDITVEVKDKDGNVIATDLTELTEDGDYTVSVKVSPKATGTATEQTAAGTGKINVYKPEITFQDSTVNYGAIPDYVDNRVENGVVWKHGDNVASAAMGAAPELRYTYDPMPKEITEDTPVKVSVSIGDTDVTEHVTFYRDACDFDGCDNPNRHLVTTSQEGNRVNFVVHLNTFDLTIHKTGAQAIDENQSFIFAITNTDGFSMNVTINGNGSVTIKNLPAGQYTVTEMTDWSWRYAPSENGKTASPTANTLYFNNSRPNEYWLDGDSYNENQFAVNQASVDP